jgi:hypothetical protein
VTCRTGPPERGSPGRPIIREPAETGHHKAVALDPIQYGPFEDGRAAVSAARRVYDLPPATGAWTAAMRTMLEDALAGTPLGLYDRQIIEWLCGWEPSTVAVIAGWITRAGQAGGDDGQEAAP